MCYQYQQKKPSSLVQSLRLNVISTVLISTLSILSLNACAEQESKGDPLAGKQKSTMCAQCHGQNGISIIPIYPNLAGQKQGYTELQLKAFRSGQRINAAMTPHAKRLTDQDILDLAAYYAQLDPSGKTNTAETK